MTDYVKPYRVIARIKNNRLWRAILETWPGVKTQTEAGEKLGLPPITIGRLLNLRTWPGNKRRLAEGKDPWWKTAQRIADSLGKDPEYLFDPNLYGLSMPQLVSIEMAMPELEARHLLELPVPTTQELTKEEVEKLLNTLTPREQIVLVKRFGLRGEDPLTLKETARVIGLNQRESARQIETKALRKLRKQMSKIK